MKVTVGPTNNVTFQAATDRGGNPAQITLTTNNSSKVTLSQVAAAGAIKDAYQQANNAYAEANLKLNIAGGTITGSLNVSGDLFVNGNTVVYNVTTFSVEDPLIYLAANNVTSDIVDIGFMGGHNTNGVYQHSGLIRHAANRNWYLFTGLSEEGHINNIVDIANTTLATLYANIAANSITLVGNTVATAANTTLAYNQANAAYSDANTRVLRAGDTMTGALNINFSGVGLNVNNQIQVGKTLSVGNSTAGISLIDDINAYSVMEIGGAQGGYINFKRPNDVDFGFRIYNQNNSTQFISGNAAHVVSFTGANVSIDTNTLAVDTINKRVGIGTNNPNANLTVIGTADVSNTVSTNTVNFGFGVYELTSNTFQTNSNTTFEVDSFSSALYSTVKYIVQVKTGTSLHSTELFCIQDGVATYMTEYATLISGFPLGNFSIDLVGGRTKLNFNPDNPLGNILRFKVVRYTITS